MRNVPVENSRDLSFFVQYKYFKFPSLELEMPPRAPEIIGSHVPNYNVIGGAGCGHVQYTIVIWFVAGYICLVKIRKTLMACLYHLQPVTEQIESATNQIIVVLHICSIE